MRASKGLSLPFTASVESAPANFPLQSLVMNLTNQCNLACTYCYEFGEDKVATPEGKPKFMDLETAKASVDFLLKESEGRKAIHITFFGGETLMNFPLLKEVVAYASDRAASEDRFIDFSLTTNATLLRGADPKTVTLDEAVRLIDERSAKGPPAKMGRRPARKKSK